MCPDNPPETELAAAPARRSGPVEPVSRQAGGAVNTVERILERGADRLWAQFTRRPLAGATIAAGLGLALATVFGAAELALAAGVGYTAHQVLRNRLPPSRALAEAFDLEKRIGG
jgi:hypothetical protein